MRRTGRRGEINGEEEEGKEEEEEEELVVDNDDDDNNDDDDKDDWESVEMERGSLLLAGFVVNRVGEGRGEFGLKLARKR